MCARHPTKKPEEKYRILKEGRKKIIVIDWISLVVCVYYVLHPGRHDVFIVFSEIWMHVCHRRMMETCIQTFECTFRERTEAEDEDDGKTRRQNIFGSHYVTLRCIISCVARGRDNILFFFSLLFICLIGIFRFLPRTRFWWCDGIRSRGFNSPMCITFPLYIPNQRAHCA